MIAPDAGGGLVGAGPGEVRRPREDCAAGFRLHVNYPCDNLNNCPGLQEGIREVFCPFGLASTCWRSSVCRASDLYSECRGFDSLRQLQKNKIPETEEVGAATRGSGAALRQSFSLFSGECSCQAGVLAFRFPELRNGCECRCCVCAARRCFRICTGG